MTSRRTPVFVTESESDGIEKRSLLRAEWAAIVGDVTGAERACSKLR